MNFAIFAGHAACVKPADRTLPQYPRGPPVETARELESLRSTVDQMVSQVRQAVLQRGGEISNHPHVVDAELAAHEQRQREFAERISRIREEEASLTLRLRREQLAEQKVNYEELFTPKTSAEAAVVCLPEVVVPEDPPAPVEKKDTPQLPPDVSPEPSVNTSVETVQPIVKPRVVLRGAKLPACATRTTAASRAAQVASVAPAQTPPVLPSKSKSVRSVRSSAVSASSRK